LYLDSDRKQIAAIGTQSSGWSYGRMPVIDWFAPTAWRNGATEVVLVNAPTSGSLKQTRQIKLGGHLVGSRRIGATLYMVLYTRRSNSTGSASDHSHSFFTHCASLLFLIV
jgi:hypothetical protein